MKRIAFVINSTSRGIENLRVELNEKLRNYEVILYETSYAGEAIRLSQKAMEDNADYLIAVGGDGTLNEVVNGYMNNPSKDSAHTIIGVLPYGSGNDFARALRLTKDIDKLQTLINDNCTGPIDVGRLSFMDQNGKSASRYFVNIADVGIGGVVAETLKRGSWFLGASFMYHKVILQSFFSYKPVKIALKSDEYNWDGKILCLCMANSRYFANGMCIAPQANISDGKIQLVIMGKVSILDYILNLSKIKKGIPLDHPEVTYVKADACTIEAEELTCPIDMDGEFVGYAPLQLSIKKHSLMFLKPKA